MTRTLVLIANAMIPGSALPWHGAPLAGMGLMAGAVVGASVATIGALLATPEWWLAGLVAILGYLALAAVASVVLWYRVRRPRVDRELIKRLHHQAAAAFLRDDRTALATATTLVQAAPGEAGAWRLLDLVARAAGDTAVAARAARRAASLESAEV